MRIFSVSAPSGTPTDVIIPSDSAYYDSYVIIPPLDVEWTIKDPAGNGPVPLTADTIFTEDRQNGTHMQFPPGFKVCTVTQSSGSNQTFWVILK